MDGNIAVKSSAPAEPKLSPPPPKSNLREQVQSLRLPSEDEMQGSAGKRIVMFGAIAVLLIGGYVAYRALTGKSNSATENVASSSTQNGARPAEAPPAPAASTPTNSVNSQPSSGPLASTSAPSGNGFGSVASSGEIAHESKGYIIPAHQILVSPKVPGMITVLKIEEGQRVKKDDMLAQLETTDYDADYARAVAAVASAQSKLSELEHGSRKEEVAQSQAELQEAEALRSQLSAEWQRIQQLRKNGVTTQSEYDLAEANYKTTDRRVERLHKAYDLMVIGPREERIDTARAELGLAKADLAKVKWRLDNTTIRAPISGTILIKRAEEGNIVNPVVMNGSYSLCEMADLSDLEVELKVQERDIAKVFKGQKCKIRAEAYPDRVYEGYVSRLMPIADRSQGAVPVRVKVSVPQNEEGVYLKPEMGAVVSFLKGDEAASR
jgi:HlyD family secretion protein